MEKMLLWIDCEMTGLDFNNDSIIEIAFICTNFNLEEKFYGSYVINKSINDLSKMNNFCLNLHKNSGLFDLCLNSKFSYSEVEDKLINLLKKHSIKKEIYIAGNSVYTDLIFIKKDFPKIYDWLSYRTFDVSTLKIINSIKNEQIFKKKENHRALDDILESIEEYKFYKKTILK